MSPRKKNTTKQSKCKKNIKKTGTLLDRMVSDIDFRNNTPKRKRDSKLKKAAKIGLGLAAVGTGAFLGNRLLNKIHERELQRDEIKNMVEEKDKTNKKKYNSIIPYPYVPFERDPSNTHTQFLTDEEIRKAEKKQEERIKPFYDEFAKSVRGIPKHAPKLDIEINNEAVPISEGLNDLINNIIDKLQYDPMNFDQVNAKNIINDMAKRIRKKDEFKYLEFKKVQDDINRYCDDYENIKEDIQIDRSFFIDIVYMIELFQTALGAYNNIMR